MDNNKLAEFKYSEKTNWKNPNIEYLKNVKIVEWDIHSAGLSVFKFRKLLPKEKLDYLETLSKKARTIREGLYQRNNPKIAQIIVDTLSDARKAFVYTNNILAEDVVSIKKDAIFVTNKIPKITKIKEFEFVKKNVYTSFINLNGVEFFYNSNTKVLDCKGLSEESKEKQKNFLLKDISNFMDLSEKIKSENIYKIIKLFRKKYLNRELPKEYYRELSTGMFRVNNYLIEEISDDLINSIDISQNYIQFIIPLIEKLL